MRLTMTADSATVDGDERGFLLEIESDEGDHLTVYLPSEVAEALHASSRSQIGNWLAEREMARATMPPSRDELKELASVGGPYADDPAKRIWAQWQLDMLP